MKRLLSKYSARWILGMIFTLLAGAHVVGIFPAAFVERIDVFLYDLRLRTVAPSLDPRIVIVDIDEKSLTEIGRFPWSRDIVAHLVTSLTDTYHVKAIGFDVLFAEADTSSGYGTLQKLANTEFKDQPLVKARIEALKPALDYDGLLAASMKDRPVALGYFLYDQEPNGMLPAPAFPVSALQGRQLDSRDWKSYRGNIAQLQRAAKGAGFFNVTLDTDGLIRSSPMLARIGNDYHESLALATAKIALGATTIRPVFITDAIMSESQLKEYIALEAIEINTAPNPIRIPVDRDLSTLVEYHGTGGPNGGGFRYVSAADVLKGRAKADVLNGRIVLIGTTAAGLNDFRSTPVNTEFPGVEVHANLIASILDGSFLQRPDWSIAYDLVQVCIAGIVLSLLLPPLAPALSMLLAISITAVVAGTNVWMYQSDYSVLPMAAVMILIFVLFLFNLGWGYLFEYRKSRAMVNLFGEYVAPELVAEMAENPENYDMEGDIRELTALFTDVRGFTTISEGLAPGPLREYINLYLTAMSEDIRGNRGTLDKYIGDAVMAFWGAPVALPNHASLAVATALKMQQSAEELNQLFIARNLPPLKIGIGLNTGQMRVGDMGSKIRRAYTVIGDAVNLASRLEGVTKNYGVGIVVGEATKLAASEFSYRELDVVTVKGKRFAVPIFEPLGLTSELPGDKRLATEQWAEALRHFRVQDWDRAELLIIELCNAYPTDVLYAMYHQRIAEARLVTARGD